MMINAFKFILLSCLTLSWLWAEDAPVKMRPRIRVYDQSADLVPVIQPVVDTRASELDLDKRIRKDVGAPVSIENPISGVSFLPTLGSASVSNQSEKPEEGAGSWISQENFLLEEDMMPKEDLVLEAEKKEADNGEMEITDWQHLQKTMISDALVKKEVEMTDEEMEEFLAAEKQGETKPEASGGLEMEALAPLENLNRPEASLENNTARMTGLDMGGFVPVLQSRTQLGGEVSRPQRERSQQLELSGSRGLLNDIKQKWEKPAERGFETGQAGFSAAGLPRESLMARPAVGNSALSSFSASNPAVRPLPAPESMLRTPVRNEMPANREAPAAQPRKEYRIRSTLGMPPGM